MKNIAQLTNDELIQLRRHFHKNPELPWQENNTINYIKKWISDQNLMNDLVIYEGKGGIWFDFLIKPDEPFLIFRADIDALEIEEKNDVSYRSKVPGVMHACGHDCHTAMLLIAMREIIRNYHRNINNNIRFVFQRAEESGSLATNSGGRTMVMEDDVCRNAKAALAIHVYSSRSSGEFWSKKGSFFANTARAELKIQTKGGHAGWPNKAENALDIMDDLIPVIRQFPQRFQSTEQGMIIINHTIAHAGGEPSSVNIVPTEASRCWSIRTESDQQQNKIEKEMKDLFKRHLDGKVLNWEFKYGRGNPAVINDINLLKKTSSLINEFAHTEHPTIMAGEDFSFFCNKVPAVFWLLGTGGIAGKTDVPHHRPNFNVDESVLWKGVLFWILMALGLKT